MIEQAERYIAFDPFLDCDRDVKIEGRKVRIVKTRKPHLCMTPNLKTHEIPTGNVARFESAIVDGRPGSFYTCLECCDYLMRCGECGAIGYLVNDGPYSICDDCNVTGREA